MQRLLPRTKERTLLSHFDSDELRSQPCEVIQIGFSSVIIGSGLGQEYHRWRQRGENLFP